MLSAVVLWAPRKLVGVLLTIAFGPEDPWPEARTRPRTPPPASSEG